MFKDKFVTSENLYFLNHSVGRMPVTTRDMVEDSYFSAWQHSEPDAWAQWFPIFRKFTEALADLFNSHAQQFCPQPNVSSGLTKLIASLPAPKQERNVILMTRNDFPSVGFVLKQAERLGYQVRFLPENDDVQCVSAWEKALTNDVVCCLITHVHFNTSKRIPVKAITSITRRKGIFSIVDIAQSSGVIPIDLQNWQADSVLGSCVKWLCGGSGAGFLWLDSAQVGRLRPMDVGWFSHENPFEFDIQHFEYANNANRFWGGTPSVLPYVVATNSIRTILNIGVDTIYQHNQKMLESIIENVPSDAIVSPIKRESRGGTLVLKLDVFKQARDKLKKARIMHDERIFGARFSPHIYNDGEEVNTLLSCLKY